MKYASAELSSFGGEQAVMRTIRELAVPALAAEVDIVIPVVNIDGWGEEHWNEELWVPIALEDPIHASMNFRSDLHNLLPESERPVVDILEFPLTEEQSRWLEHSRRTQTATYTFIGSVAASDLHLDPNMPVREVDRQRHKQLNKAFENFIGEWGGVLMTSVELVNIEGSKETLTQARFAIYETETEWQQYRTKNPESHFNPTE
jgi:hypothetical protein